MTEAMKQMSLSESGFERKTKRTRKREFLDEMDLVVPWAELVEPARSVSCCRIAGSYPDKAFPGKRPRPAVKMGWSRAYGALARHSPHPFIEAAEGDRQNPAHGAGGPDIAMPRDEAVGSFAK